MKHILGSLRKENLKNIGPRWCLNRWTLRYRYRVLQKLSSAGTTLHRYRRGNGFKSRLTFRNCQGRAHTLFRLLNLSSGVQIYDISFHLIFICHWNCFCDANQITRQKYYNNVICVPWRMTKNGSNGNPLFSSKFRKIDHKTCWCGILLFTITAKKSSK